MVSVPTLSSSLSNLCTQLCINTYSLDRIFNYLKLRSADKMFRSALKPQPNSDMIRQSLISGKYH